MIEDGIPDRCIWHAGDHSELNNSHYFRGIQANFGIHRRLLYEKMREHDIE
jgi:hypothetical protein